MGRRNFYDYNFDIGGESIEIVEDYMYLDLLINYIARFCKGELELKDRSSRPMYSPIAMFKKYYFKKYCSRSTLLVDKQMELFNATLLRIVMHACEIWGCYVVKYIELLFMKFLKQVLNVLQNASNDGTFDELCVLSLVVHIVSRMAEY